MLHAPWAALGWGAFILLHAHPSSAVFALPVLLVGLSLAGLLAQVDLATRPDVRELAVTGFGIAWLIASLFALDPARALALSVPTSIAVVCALVLPRAEARHPGAALRATVLALTALGLGACLSVLADGASESPEQLVERAALPWLVVPNDLAWMGCLWPLWWRWSRAEGGARLRMLAVAAVSLVLALALILLQSRLGLLVLAVAFGIEVIGPAKRRRWLALAIAIATVSLLVFLIPGLAEKGVASGQARLQLWQAAWSLFLEHPALGVGPHGFVVAYPEALQDRALVDPRLTPWPHSLPLEILCSGGLLLALACVIVLTLKLRAPSGGLPVALGVSFLFVCLLEASTLRVWFWFWFLLWALPPSPRYAGLPTRLTD